MQAKQKPMFTIREAAQRLWEAQRSGGEPPEELKGRLTMEHAYPVQMEVLALHLAAGQTLAGWKIGQTSRPMRQATGATSPALGYLLGGRGFASPHRLELAGARDCALEPELAFILAQSLQGPGITRERVREAVASVAPAFELVRSDPRWTEPAFKRAGNAGQWGYVLGQAVPGCPHARALDELRLRLTNGDEVHLEAMGRDVNDNPLDSAAWLANALAAHGRALEPGQVILTGSYSRLMPLRSGDRWEASFEGIGAVALSAF